MNLGSFLINPFKLWMLHIKQVHKDDTGWYECQIAMDPPRSHAVYLEVISKLTFDLSWVLDDALGIRVYLCMMKISGAQGKIQGRSEILVNAGSPLVLVCDVENAMVPPQFILWYHNSRVINYDDRAELNITKYDRQADEHCRSRMNHELKGTSLMCGLFMSRSSKLGVSRVTGRDSGNYTCAPSTAQNDTTLVHVLNGESTEINSGLFCSYFLCLIRFKQQSFFPNAP